jgi:hypothetical protein
MSLLLLVTGILASMLVSCLAYFSVRRVMPIERGAATYFLDRKCFWLSVIIELIIGVTSLLGAAVFAARYGRDSIEMTVMMLPAIGFAAIESVRIPLSIRARTQASRSMRVLAFVAMLLSAGVTAKQFAQTVDMGLEPRLNFVRAARSTLDDALSAQASFAAQVQRAQATVEQSRNLYAEAQARARAAGESLSHVPHCRYCNTGADSAVLRDNLRGSSSEVAAAKRELEGANARLAQLNPGAINQAVRAAEVALRDALNGSQLHLLAGSLMGVQAANVSEDAMAWLMRLLVILPSALVSLTASILAMVSVTPRPSTEIPNVWGTLKTMLDKNLQLRAALASATAGAAASEPETPAPPPEAPPQPAPEPVPRRARRAAAKKKPTLARASPWAASNPRAAAAKPNGKLWP